MIKIIPKQKYEFFQFFKEHEREIQDFLLEEMDECIDKNFTDFKQKGLQELFETDKHDIGEDIKRVLESGCYSKYIRVPKSIQDYLKMRDMVHREVSDHIQKVEVETWSKCTDNLLKFDRGLRRETKILEQRMNGEYQ